MSQIFVQPSGSFAAHELRFRYQIVDGNDGSFDWTPNFSMNEAELLVDFIDRFKSVVNTNESFVPDLNDVIFLGALPRKLA